MSSLVDASTAQDIFLFLKGFSSPLIVVLGPSASGKTDFSLNVAEAIVSKHRRAEIVNADSRQLYRFLDIGTGKITPHEMRGIPHHLLDILDPKEEATAAMYQSRTTSTIDAILKEGSVPILVGGSMLYLSSIIDALSFPEASNPKIRTELNAARLKLALM